MRNIKMIILVIISSLITNSCSNDDAVTSSDSEPIIETLTFGRYYGRCIGNTCVEVFKLKNGVLREDISDTKPVPGEFFKGNFIVLLGELGIDKKALLSEFPEELLNEKDTYSVIGNPNAGDRGSIYIEYQNVDVRKQFIIDPEIGILPKYLRGYVKLVNETVSQINAVNSEY